MRSIEDVIITKFAARPKARDQISTSHDDKPGPR
jgi:hypothetical protein